MENSIYTYAHTKDGCKKFEAQSKRTAADWLTSACMFTFLRKLHFLIKNCASPV